MISHLAEILSFNLKLFLIEWKGNRTNIGNRFVNV
jgi:hypothetical protein